MNLRKHHLTVAFDVWARTVTEALTRAHRERLGARVTIGEHGGDAVCELLADGAVISRYETKGVRPELPLATPAAAPASPEATAPTVAPVETPAPAPVVPAAPLVSAQYPIPLYTTPEDAEAARVGARTAREIARQTREGAVPTKASTSDDCALCLGDRPAALVAGVDVTVRAPTGTATYRVVTIEGEAVTLDAVVRPMFVRVPDRLQLLAPALAWTEGRWETTWTPAPAPAPSPDPASPTHWRYGWSARDFLHFTATDLAALAAITPTAYVWCDLAGGGTPAWWEVTAHDGRIGSEVAEKLTNFCRDRKVSVLSRHDTERDRATLATRPQLALHEAAGASEEIVDALDRAHAERPSKRHLPVVKEESSKAPTKKKPMPTLGAAREKAKARGELLRVLVLPDSEVHGGLKGFDWQGITRGLSGWNPAKTPEAGSVGGGSCRPLQVAFAPAAHPDVVTLRRRLDKAQVPYLDAGELARGKEFDHAPSLRTVRAKWNAAHPRHAVALNGKTWAPKPTKKATTKPAKKTAPAPTATRRGFSPALPPTAEDVAPLPAAEGDGFGRVLSDVVFVHPTLPRADWDRLTPGQREQLAAFRTDTGMVVTTDWKEGATHVASSLRVGRQSGIAQRLEAMAAGLGVTLVFEPVPAHAGPSFTHEERPPVASPEAPVGGRAEPSTEPLETPLEELPPVRTKLHRHTPEPAADRRARRERHTLVATDDHGAWTIKRERKGQTAPAWEATARQLVAEGRQVRRYDGAQHCVWDSRDDAPAPAPATAPATTDATPPPETPAATWSARISAQDFEAADDTLRAQLVAVTWTTVEPASAFDAGRLEAALTDTEYRALATLRRRHRAKLSSLVFTPREGEGAPVEAAGVVAAAGGEA